MSSPSRQELFVSLSREVRKFIAGAIFFSEKVARQLGLNGTDLQCLNLLELQGPMTPGELARCCSLTTGGITVVLDRLEKEGYVARRPNPKDRRSSLVVLLPERGRNLREMYKSRGEKLAMILSAYDERKMRLILDFFTRANNSNEAWRGPQT